MCQNCDKFIRDWKKANKGKEPADECYCNGDNRDIEDVVHYGNFKELFEYCNNCGGVII
jgi:hypothetical protein